jgi:hypothetical protein
VRRFKPSTLNKPARIKRESNEGDENLETMDVAVCYFKIVQEAISHSKKIGLISQ